MAGQDFLTKRRYRNRVDPGKNLITKLTKIGQKKKNLILKLIKRGRRALKKKMELGHEARCFVIMIVVWLHLTREAAKFAIPSFGRKDLSSHCTLYIVR